MPKDYACPCGQMEVRFPGNSKVQLKGGYTRGESRSVYICRNNECQARKRIGYDHELLDSDGNVFHRVGIDGPSGRGNKGGKTTTRKPTNKQNKNRPRRNRGRAMAENSWFFPPTSRDT